MKLKRPKIPMPEGVKRLHDKWSLRPVKHPSLHKVLHVYLPAVFLWFFGVCWIGDVAFNYLNENTNGLLIIASLVAWVFFVIYLYRATYTWLSVRSYQYTCFHAEPMEAEDKGEDLEVGPGWRRIRFTFAITIGHGRVARPRMEWIEFGLNPMADPPMIPLAASDPLAQQAFEEHAAANPMSE